MGFNCRFRRSFKLAPGVRLNVNKRSGGVTLGGRSARLTLNGKGQHTLSARTGIKGLIVQSRAKRR